MFNRFQSILLVAVVTGAGCTSISSTMLNRDNTNQVWERHPHIKGVPITLKVPTHVKIYIYEHHFLSKVQVGDTERVRRIELPYPVRDFAQEFIYTEKIFTVDFKRPAAGMFNLRLDMTEDQYIQKVQHDVTDQTIERIGGLLETLGVDTLFAGVVADGENTVDSRVREVTTVVAVGIFEVDAPDFEQQLAAFINCHLNQAHDAWTMPPNVDRLNRVGVIGYQDDSHLCRKELTPWDGSMEPIRLPGLVEEIARPNPISNP